MKNEYENGYENDKTNKTKEATELEDNVKETDFEESGKSKSEEGLNENETVNDSSASESETSDTEDNSTAADEQTSENNETTKLKEENAALKEKYTRLLAEFENFRKRSDKERLSMIDIGASEVLTKLLPVIDNFDRAIESMNNLNKEQNENAQNSPEDKSKQEENFTKGIEQIYKQLQKFLEDLDVKKIKALGEQFDPSLHNAVMTDEESDAKEGTITADLQPGYTYKDQILRHSMVKVKK